MELKIEPLRLAGLNNMEAGQLINRHLSDLDTIAPELLVDAPYNSYVQTLTNKATVYQKALAQIRVSEETEKIGLADDQRDKSVSAFSAALKLHSLSDDPAEVETSRSLGIIFNNLKNMAAMNYEAETMAIDKLTSELDSPANVVKISSLHMDRYVARLKSDNEQFKIVFSGRIQSEANSETYDMKIVRAETMKIYIDFCNYVLAMTKATNTALFSTTLNLLNTARKYYADLLARRAGVKKANDKPVD